MRPTIALLTDFGLDDPYVAQMKGAILSRHPDAVLVDLCHTNPAYDLARGALFLEASRKHFPQGAIFVGVIDPGVGSERRIVTLERDGQYFLAPDNGLLSLVLAVPGKVRAWDVTGHVQDPAISSTFHGRDVFAPLAASLGAGTLPSDLGPEIDPASLMRLPWAEPLVTEQPFQVKATILHVDRFGNCLTNLAATPWATRLTLGTELGMTLDSGQFLQVLRVNTYATLQGNRIGLILCSQGYLELSMNQASAATATALTPGESIIFSTKEDESR
ncbi:SAM hydrolase/SAM-dependent halogenase family protein [Desulfovibrio ferrophilus]|uniref:SAM-dependent chlorinase/fluorinase n=1 Tax=Desulfovibrio ferrophilus TaxID=241368 RepID=A0A2Z6B281_9BACT|nr:SAM-dependent chlorinase/fluorinase [Desulfovibrio ferrophilus]BBD09627.1 uncharacterized protein DFE_2901 [Desulfovibrio ferrophilus]